MLSTLIRHLTYCPSLDQGARQGSPTLHWVGSASSVDPVPLAEAPASTAMAANCLLPTSSSVRSITSYKAHTILDILAPCKWLIVIRDNLSFVFILHIYTTRYDFFFKWHSHMLDKIWLILILISRVQMCN